MMVWFSLWCSLAKPRTLVYLYLVAIQRGFVRGFKGIDDVSSTIGMTTRGIDYIFSAWPCSITSQLASGYQSIMKIY